MLAHNSMIKRPALLAALTLLLAPHAAANRTLAIYAIDVGQGDATLIVGPTIDQQQVSLLIDAGDFRPGKAPGADLVQRVLDLAHVDHIDYLVLTHYDADHMGGFIDSRTSHSLIWTLDDADTCTPTELFPRRAILDIGPPVKDAHLFARRQWRHCVPQISASVNNHRHIEITAATDVQHTFDLGGGYTARTVAGRGFIFGHPDPIADADSPNEMSIAVLISSSDGFDFLVTGDLIGVPSDATENALLEDALADAIKADVDLDVLRVGHHGAANATSAHFIETLKPEVAIISVGAESQQGENYNHPDCATLRTLQHLDAVIQTGAGDTQCPSLQPLDYAPTVANGTVLIEVDGQAYTIDSIPGTSSTNAPTATFRYVCDARHGCSADNSHPRTQTR